KVRFEFDNIERQGKQKTRIVMKQQVETDQWGEPAPDEWKTLDEKDLQRNWFSDGGSCSYFPIHFFDAWLATRPTFGFDLTSQLSNESSDQGGNIRKVIRSRSSHIAQQAKVMPKPDDAEALAETKDVYLPQPESVPLPEWIPIPGLVEFF